MSASARASNDDALKDKNFDTPQPIGDNEFLQERITNVKEEVEEELESNEKFSTFKAIKFIKRNAKYVVRVDCGEGQYIDVKLNGQMFQDFDANKKLDDPMKF